MYFFYIQNIVVYILFESEKYRLFSFKTQVEFFF